MSTDRRILDWLRKGDDRQCRIQAWSEQDWLYVQLEEDGDLRGEGSAPTLTVAVERALAEALDSEEDR